MMVTGAVKLVLAGGLTAVAVIVGSVFAIKHMTLAQAIQVLTFLSKLQRTSR